MFHVILTLYFYLLVLLIDGNPVWITLHDISISHVPIMHKSKLISMQSPDKNIAYKESTWSITNIHAFHGQ